jgi:predicted phosphodiesterase
MKALLVGDIHLSDRPPSSCTESYLDDLFDLLEETTEVAKDRQVDAVIWAGDVFHHKQPNRTSHRLVQRTIELIRAYSCELWIVPGNHDMANDRQDSINDTQPLGVLFSTGTAGCLDGWMNGVGTAYGIPWQQEFTPRVLHDHAYFVGLSSAATNLVVMHAPIYPPGKENPWECLPAGQVADIIGGPADRPNHIFYGHVHDDHGIYTASGPEGRSAVFCNHGALTRGSLQEYNLTRMPAVTLWDPYATEPLVRVPLARAKTADLIFRSVEAAGPAVQDRLDAFLGAISVTTVSVTSVEAVIAHIRAMGLDVEVEKLAIELLEAA